jgi:cell division transport system permease protein
MFSRIGYILRETAANLTRNLTLTIASLLTVVVSLSFVGFVFLIQDAVSNQLFEWKDGVEVSIFMSADATQDQIDAVQRDLEQSNLVKPKGVRFVNKDEARQEIKQLFPNTPEIVDITKAEDVPTSFRIKPSSTESSVISAITNQFNKRPGVILVRSADQAIAFIRKISSFARWGLGVGAVSLLAAAVLLIWNTIRTAMFARRREIEVMKLVGATNWFIRWPFIIEGMVQGLFGATVACAIVWVGKNLWRSKVIGSFGSSLSFENLQATAVQFRGVMLLLLAIGAIAGAFASAIASSRFLDV